jgi:hypothetical protein
MGTPLHNGERPESRKLATIEVVTTPEGNAEEAVLIDDR